VVVESLALGLARQGRSSVGAATAVVLPGQQCCVADCSSGLHLQQLLARPGVQESVGRWQRLFTGHQQLETLLQDQMLLAT